MDNLQAIERFSRIERCIDDVIAVCRDSAGAPDELRQCMDELELRSQEARRLVEQDASAEAADPARLFECADRLKSLSDQAAQACDAAEGLDGTLCSRVHEMQNDIAHFRRQLHGTENRREARPAVVPTKH